MAAFLCCRRSCWPDRSALSTISGLPAHIYPAPYVSSMHRSYELRVRGMPAHLGIQHWRARAEEARKLAELMAEEDLKWRMLRIASDYDKLAERAETVNGT